MDKSKESVSSVDRAVDVIEFIYRAGGECALGEAAKGLGVSKSSVHRLLQTLKQRNFIYQDEKTGHYGLGTRLFVLGRMVGDNMAFLKTVKPYADRLNARFGECVHITVPYHVAGELPRQLLIGKIQNPSGVLRVSPDVGAITYCHASASGKCMLAFGKPQVLEGARGMPLISFTGKTITSWEVLDRQLDEIRGQGYATEDGETENGLSCTAVPVLNRAGELCVVISISGPTSRIRALDQGEVVEALKAVAHDMSSSIS